MALAALDDDLRPDYAIEMLVDLYLAVEKDLVVGMELDLQVRA